MAGFSRNRRSIILRELARRKNSQEESVAFESNESPNGGEKIRRQCRGKGRKIEAARRNEKMEESYFSVERKRQHREAELCMKNSGETEENGRNDRIRIVCKPGFDASGMQKFAAKRRENGGRCDARIRPRAKSA